MDADDKRYHFIILNSGEDLLSRIQFIQDYTLKSIRLKPEKWAKLVISDEQRRHLENFVYKDLPQVLIISQNIGGQLQIHTDWPSPLRNKGVFFVKREPLPLPKKVIKLLNHMTCGDIHPNSLEHFCALVEEVMVPILRNEANMTKFPQCISDGNTHFTNSPHMTSVT